jgi:hypothetical protein
VSVQTSASANQINPNDEGWYTALLQLDVLFIIWEFLRLNSAYCAAVQTHLTALVPDAIASKIIAQRFGLRELVSPGVTPLPDTGLFFPPLDNSIDDSGKLSLVFDLGMPIDLQLQLARWMMLNCIHRGNKVRHPRRTRHFTVRRLTFLLRTLHCKQAGLSNDEAVAVLRPMRKSWNDDMRVTGRIAADGEYNAAKYKADLRAAEAIRDQKITQLLHEARISHYIAPEDRGPNRQRPRQ